MTPTEILKQEHQVILTMLEIMKAIYTRLKDGQEVPGEHLRRMVDFIRGFADQIHHGKEEDILFKEMAAAGIPREGGPVGVMLEEHVLGRNFVKGLADAIEKVEADNAEAVRELLSNIRGYVDLLSHHIYKEDNILYPMADARLSEEQQARMSADFTRVDEQKVGPDAIAAHHLTVEELKAIYLA